MKIKYRSITLIELLVSLVLFLVIVMGLSSFEIFGHFHSITSDRRALVQNELSLVLEHITKNITGTVTRGGAIGDLTNPPFVLDSDQTGFSIRIDSPINSALASGINYSNDVWIGYHQVVNAMLFYPSMNAAGSYSGTYEVIATHLLPTNTNIASGGRGFELNPPGSISSPNVCTVFLTARWNPGSPITLDNPQAQMQATIVAPSVSTN